MTIQDIFEEIEKELPRSLALHPAEEWASFRPTQMLPHVDKELDEIRNALVVRDFHGPHGVYAEINHAIIVLVRMRMELERRQE